VNRPVDVASDPVSAVIAAPSYGSVMYRICRPAGERYFMSPRAFFTSGLPDCAIIP